MKLDLAKFAAHLSTKRNFVKVSVIGVGFPTGEGLLLRSHKLENETVTHFGPKPGLRLSWDHLLAPSKEAIRRNLARHRDFHIELQPYVE